MKTQREIRQSFFEYCDEIGARYYPNKRQHEQPVDTRMLFVDYVDDLAREGMIPEALAHRVTL